MVAVTGGGFYKQASKHNKVKVLFFSCCDDAISFRSLLFGFAVAFRACKSRALMGFSSSRSSSSSHRGGNLVSIGRNYESIAENRRGSNSVWVKLTNGILV
jgi:hypothetical protein